MHNFKQKLKVRVSMSLIARCTYHLLQNCVKVGRIKSPRCSTPSASRVNRLRVRKSLHPVDQRLVRPNCQDQVESPRMHLIIGRISFTRVLWRVAIEQRGVKDGVDSRGSSHDTRGDEKAISGGHYSEVLRKGVEYVVLCFRRLTACPSFVIRVVGISGPESPDDSRLTLFDE
jgi:hypothetical protein